MPGWFGWFGWFRTWFGAWLGNWSSTWLGRIRHLSRLCRRGPQAVEQHAPNQATVILPDGMQIPCAIFEDPEGGADGLRQFWLEPIRPIPAGTISARLWVDVLPPRSRASIRLPGVLDGHLRASWRDQYGEHSDQPVQRLGSEPNREQDGPPDNQPGNGNRFGNGQSGADGQDIRDNG